MTDGAPRDSPPLVLAVDLGGSQIRAAIVTGRGDLVARHAAPTPGRLGRRAVIDAVIDAVERVRTATSRPIAAIGVSTLGPVDAARGVIRSAPTIVDFDAVPLGSELAERFGLPVHLVNDANAAAIAEWALGAARGASTLCYVTVSTGIGCGIVVDGRLLLGYQGHAGELGRILVSDGPGDGRGFRPLEDLASGTAIARFAREQGLRAPDGGEPSARDTAAAALAGDERARSAFERAAATLGLQLGNLVRLLNPETIVIGGGVARAGEFYWQPLRRSLADALAGYDVHVPSLVPAQLSDDAGLHGAAIEVRRLLG
jgi:glucokinase